MKLADLVTDLTLSENLSYVNYRMKVNAKSFNQLYSGLYTQKIEAIIRELSTNAIDSHFAAGKTNVPFEVHLPNALEPFFSVTDFGTGLSPEQIASNDGEAGHGIYITFWESNKTESDDFAGCLGLGSKSPFAYTDNFTVESRWNGKKYLYINTHNEKGEPCIVHMGSTDTDECNGMKIEFAVKSDDFSEFYAKAAVVLSWFTNRPKVTGYSSFEFNEHEYLRKTQHYGVLKKHGDSYVVMGNVAYPLNFSNFSYGKLTDIEKKVIDWGVHLFVNIGDVEFVPSREHLSMTEKTINGVKKFLGDAIKSIQDELIVQVQNQPTIWSARKMLYDIKYSVLGKVRPITTLTYNGKEISEYIKVAGILVKDAAGNPVLDVNGYNTYEKKADLLLLSRKREHYRSHRETTLYCNYPIYILDIAHGGLARIGKHLRVNNIDEAYAITAKKEYLDETGISEVSILASSLPKIVRQKRVISGDGTKSYIKRTTLQQYNPNNKDHWSDVEKNVKGGGVYVITSYGQIVGSGDSRTPPVTIAQKINNIKTLDPNFVLYGIRPAGLGKMGRYASMWIKLDDYLAKLIKSKSVLLQKAILIQQFAHLQYEERWELFRDIYFASDSLFLNFVNRVEAAKVVTDDAEVKAFTELNKIADIVPITGEQELVDMENVVMKTYPLFNHIDWCRSDELREGLTDYIRGVDNRLSKTIQLREVV